MKEPLTYPLSKVTPDKTAMEFGCTTVAPVVRHLEDRLGEQRARQVIYDTQMNWDYLQERQHWVSFSYFCRLLDRAVDVTGEEDLPYEAAFRYTDVVSVSFVGVCVLRAFSVRQAYHAVAQWSRFWSKIHKSDIPESGDDYVIFRNTYPKYRQTRNNCLSVQGALASIPKHWGLGGAKVTELECCCRGDPHCTYRVTWETPKSLANPRVGLALGLGIGGAALAATGLSIPAVSMALALGLSGYLGTIVWENRKTINKLNRDNQAQTDSLLAALRRMEEFNSRLQETIEERTRELSNTNEELEETLEKLHASQAKMVEQERDAAIGVLAAGMAHELNSPINAIRLSVQALLEDIPEDDPDHVLLAASERATSRCRRMVNDLLCFARDKRVSLVGDLRDAVYQAVETFAEEIQDACPVHVSVADDLPVLTVDKAQIQQALSNLLINAHDAMEGRGEINISLDPVDGEAVCLAVADTGPGMTEEKKNRIFEPFFSTKANGKGLGIGLAISRQLFERNGATVAVDTALGEGTRFLLTFRSRDNEMAGLHVESREKNHG